MALKYVTIHNEELGLTGQCKEESVPAWEAHGYTAVGEEESNSEIPGVTAKPKSAPVEEAPQEPVSEPVQGTNPAPDIP